MGIEPSDVTGNAWQRDNVPAPLPEPGNLDYGIPALTDLNWTPDEATFCTIGQSVYIRMKVKGKKKIKVTMSEKMFDEKQTKNEICVVNLGKGDAGVQITIRCRREGMVGQHELVFEATNELGTAMETYYLVIQGRNNGG